MSDSGRRDVPEHPSVLLMPGLDPVLPLLLREFVLFQNSARKQRHRTFTKITEKRPTERKHMSRTETTCNHVIHRSVRASAFT